jgi:hypothetical protein
MKRGDGIFDSPLAKSFGEGWGGWTFASSSKSAGLWQSVFAASDRKISHKIIGL